MREMTAPQGGFYSSLDADSEGVEGKFYVWTLDEIRETLKDESEFFETAYGITANGNWEGRIVLQRSMDDSSLAARFKLAPESVPAKLKESHLKLLAVRSPRIRPGTDDKILTAWNGLMLAAFAEAARVLQRSPKSPDFGAKSPDFAVHPDYPSYLNLATRSAEFLLNELRHQGSTPPLMARRQNNG